jgi:hypothetical protein
MTPVLWTAIGLSIGAIVLHSALGLRRPLERTYLSFALIMGCVAVFLYLQWQLYRAITSDAVVETKRLQVSVVNVFLGSLFVFVPAYTKVRIPRRVMIALWATLGVMFAANLFARYGVWYAGEPELAPSTFRGEPYTTVIAQPMGALQLAYSGFFTAFLILSLGCAVKVFRRGERRRGLTFGIAVALVLAHGLLDVVRDNVGGAWPYVAEYGVVTWGLIMSVQLALDFRAQTQSLANAIAHVEAQSHRLTAMLDALHRLELDIQAPLDTLERGVMTLGDGAQDDELRRVERSIVRLRELASSMPDIKARPSRGLLPG